MLYPRYRFTKPTCLTCVSHSGGWAWLWWRGGQPILHVRTLVWCGGRGSVETTCSLSCVEAMLLSMGTAQGLFFPSSGLAFKNFLKFDVVFSHSLCKTDFNRTSGLFFIFNLKHNYFIYFFSHSSLNFSTAFNIQSIVWFISFFFGNFNLYMYQ